MIHPYLSRKDIEKIAQDISQHTRQPMSPPKGSAIMLILLRWLMNWGLPLFTGIFLKMALFLV